jgi:hypothetical protein
MFTPATSVENSGNAAHDLALRFLVKMHCVRLGVDRALRAGRPAGPRPQQPVVEILVTPLTHRVQAEALPRPPTRPTRSGGPGAQRVDRVSGNLAAPSLPTSGTRPPTHHCPAGVNQFSVATDRGRDHRQAAGHRFQNGVRDAFDQAMAGRNNPALAGSPARRSRSPGQPCQFGQRRPVRASSAPRPRSGPSPIITSRKPALQGRGNASSTRMKASARCRLILDHLHAPNGTHQPAKADRTNGHPAIG